MNTTGGSVLVKLFAIVSATADHSSEISMPDYGVFLVEAKADTPSLLLTNVVVYVSAAEKAEKQEKRG